VLTNRGAPAPRSPGRSSPTANLDREEIDVYRWRHRTKPLLSFFSETRTVDSSKLPLAPCRQDSHATSADLSSKLGRPVRSALRFVLESFVLILISVLSVFFLALVIVRIEPFLREREPAFDEAHPRVGELAPDLTLRDIANESFHLAEQFGRRPMVIEFGSFT
jgi:hypothetical protein